MWTEVCEAKALDGASWTSEVVVLRDKFNIHAIEYLISGAGTLAIEIQTSISGRSWTSNGNIVSGIGATSGPDSDGKDSVGMRLKPGEFIRFKLTSTGATITTLWFTQK